MPDMKHLTSILSILLPATITAMAADQPLKVIVHAGGFDRRGTVVNAVLPDKAKVQGARLGGKFIPVQTDGSNRISWAVADLKKGQSETYELLPEIAVVAPVVFTRKDGNKLRFGSAAKRKTLMEYQAEAGELPRDNIKAAFKRGGYLHPILTPSGKQVTDDFPTNHIHHHGVWWAWTHTKFQGRTPDYWNMGDGKGRVEFDGLDTSWSGPVHGGFRSSLRQVDLLAAPSVTALKETWEVRAYPQPSGVQTYWVFDVTVEDRCATGDALELPEYRYGGIGLRGNWAWNGKDKVNFLTSDGETDRIKGNATRGRWCDMWGDIDGAKAGIAILGHPSNFSAPQPMRLHPTEPFFNFAPQQAGDMVIKPGETFTARYRFVVHDGPPDRVELDRLWNDYANPPEVRVVAEQ